MSAPSPISKFLLSPFTIVGFLLAGGLVGAYEPNFAVMLKPIGDTYLGLLKLIVLPFIVSSIIFSLRSMVTDKHSSRYLGRMFGNVLIVSLVAVMITGALGLIMKPGQIDDVERRIEFGRIVGGDEASYNANMTLKPPAGGEEEIGVLERVLDVIPTNIFVSLSNGDTAQVLVFAILFGFALGSIPFEASGSLAQSLDAVYRACMILTRWFLLLLPIGSFAMIASQIAVMGFDPLMLMIDFLAVLAVITVFFLYGSMLVVAQRSRVGVLRTFREHSQLLLMAVTTRSSVACIPLIIEVLVNRLRFNKAVVELLVPLQTVLLRVGSIILYVLGPIFIAQLYGRDLDTNDLVMIAVYSVILGLTTAGMSGLVVISQLSIICGALGLPFEAAFVLFVAVDTVADVLRTVILVSTISAATAVIAPREETARVSEDEPETRNAAA